MKKTIAIILIIFLVILSSAGLYTYTTIYLPAGNDNTNIAFEVNKGQSISTISQELQQKKLIKSALIFKFYVWLTGGNILPGVYYLKSNMTAKEIAETLSSGKINENKITIPEGWRVTDIADYLAKNNLADKNDFIVKAANLEGYLFPDTYRLAKDATASNIVKLLNDNFYTKTKSLNPTKDQLILASIVEREAKFDKDRATIAGVYQNRLNDGMKLEADPTVQYAKGDWSILSLDDLTINSPYNTYLNTGLPPTPICNPGLASIKAAINPEKNDYFYFFHLADGTTIYSKTLDEHNANLAKYKDKM